MYNVSEKCHERTVCKGCSSGTVAREDLSSEEVYEQGLNIMMKQSQANVWEEHSTKRGISSVKTSG